MSQKITCEYCSVEASDYFEFGPYIDDRSGLEIEKPLNEPWWCSLYCYEEDEE